MLKKKEMLAILISLLVLTISIAKIDSLKTVAYTALAIFLVLIVNISAKKGLCYYLDSEIEIGIWKVRRYGFLPHQELKKPFPLGVVMPILVSLLSLGNLLWMAVLKFDLKPKIYRAAKRHGLYSFTEVTEYQTGLIASVGILANLILAVIGYFLGYPLFTSLNIWYAFFNILPISDLDGNKIFFGSLVLWSFIASIVVIAVGYALLLI